VTSGARPLERSPEVDRPRPRRRGPCATWQGDVQEPSRKGTLADDLLQRPMIAVSLGLGIRSVGRERSRDELAGRLVGADHDPGG
jgi:hypothetical protein